MNIEVMPEGIARKLIAAFGNQAPELARDYAFGIQSKDQTRAQLFQDAAEIASQIIAKSANETLL